MKYFKKLEGERIYLSPRNVEDVEIFTKWMNGFYITDYIGRSHQTMTLQEEKEYLENTANDKNTFAIIDSDTDNIIGTVGLHGIDYINRTARLGIFIGDREYWSKGYGTEAVRLILDFGFNYLNLNNIDLVLMEFNERALKCYQKCGFKEIGRKRKCKFINGRYWDSILMDILAEEFKESYIKNKNI
jgi:RimJ/RimL family protein N-acetyltransferase